MIPRERIEATMRFLDLDPMQAYYHERQREALKAALRAQRRRFSRERRAGGRMGL